MKKDCISAEVQMTPELQMTPEVVCSKSAPEQREKVQMTPEVVCSKSAPEQHEMIDRAYIGSLKEKKRTTQINDICRMLLGMTPQQVENVHKYTSDEYIEPNHEAEALEAILQISRKHTKRQNNEEH